VFRLGWSPCPRTACWPIPTIGRKHLSSERAGTAPASGKAGALGKVSCVPLGNSERHGTQNASHCHLFPGKRAIIWSEVRKNGNDPSRAKRFALDFGGLCRAPLWS